MADKIRELIKQMDTLADKERYEDAQNTLQEIKYEINKPFDFLRDVKPPTFEQLFEGAERDPITLKETHEMMIDRSIRLNSNSYPFANWLLLISQVNDKQNDKKVKKDLRKIVAEQMVCKEMKIPASYRGKKPNRAFLDELVRTKGGVDICGDEMERRLKSLLWQAIETKDHKKIKDAQKNLKDFRMKKIFRE